MNNFETIKIQPVKENNKESILNDWDKKILLEGSKNVVDKILKEFKGKLPSGIIYPDTSARPLFYLFDAIFSKISKEKNIPKPKSFFMKIHKTDTDTYNSEYNKGKKLSYDEAKEELHEQIEFTNKYRGEPYPKDLLEFVHKIMKETQENRAIAKDRALEINNYNEKLSDQGIIPNLAVIDEFSNTGRTFNEIQYSFGENIPYFSIFGFDSENDVSDENIGLLLDRNEYFKNPTKNHTKLSYTTGNFRKSIGVNKENDNSNKYSEVNKNQTPNDKKMMETLRNEMKEIGEQIAKEY